MDQKQGDFLRLRIHSSFSVSPICICLMYYNVLSSLALPPFCVGGCSSGLLHHDSFHLRTIPFLLPNYTADPLACDYHCTATTLFYYLATCTLSTLSVPFQTLKSNDAIVLYCDLALMVRRPATKRNDLLPSNLLMVHILNSTCHSNVLPNREPIAIPC